MTRIEPATETTGTRKGAGRPRAVKKSYPPKIQKLSFTHTLESSLSPTKTTKNQKKDFGATKRELPHTTCFPPCPSCCCVCSAGRGCAHPQRRGTHFRYPFSSKDHFHLSSGRAILIRNANSIFRRERPFYLHFHF